MGQTEAWWVKQKPGGSNRSLVGQTEAWWVKQKPGGSNRSLVGQTEAWWVKQKPGGSNKSLVGQTKAWCCIGVKTSFIFPSGLSVPNVKPASSLTPCAIHAPPPPLPLRHTHTGHDHQVCITTRSAVYVTPTGHQRYAVHVTRTGLT